MAEPTYEELRAEREKEWEVAQRRAAAAARAMQETIAKMPDVLLAPAGDAVWGHPGIACACGGEGFACQRWVTVNGIRHRAEFRCLGCQTVGTWDWATMAWIDVRPRVEIAEK